MRGILPIGQSTILEPLFLAQIHRTGSGESYSNCGSFFTKGCLNSEKHEGIRDSNMHLDPTGKGAGYFRRFNNSCDRPLCPVCWESWANREKDKAVQRIQAFKIRGKPIHVMISVPREDYGLTVPEMRVKVYKNLKAVHMIGGMLIFHPDRKNDLDQWFFSPHFHALGYGWIQDVRRNYYSGGYVVKNLRIRKTVEGTIFYQLSHCGISEQLHTVTWFGALSYNKLKVIYKEPKPVVCEMCGSKLKKVMWIGKGIMPLPDIEGVGFLDDPGGWMYFSRAPTSDDCSTKLGDLY